MASEKGTGPRASGQPRLALKEFHRNEQRFTMFADLIELADIRMIDAGCGASFAPEALSRHLIVWGITDDFERDRPVQPFILGGIHDSHPTLAKLANDSIVPNPVR